MDFTIPIAHKTFYEEVKIFAESLNEDVTIRDQSSSFDRDLWRRCAGFGIQGLAAPSAFGGQEAQINFNKAVLGLEGFGYGCRDNGLAFGLNAQMWTVQLPLAEFGTDETKEKYLKPLVLGTMIGAHAVTEEEAGSDTAAMKTVATKVSGGYVLTGSKCFVTLAPIADLVIVFARTNPKMGRWGISAFIVESDAEGFTITRTWDKMGMRTVPMGDIKLDSCFVKDSQLLGGEGAGFSILNHALEHDRGCVLASQLGSMHRQLDDTVHFVKERKQFGEPIGKFQSVSNRVVNMKLRLETARLLLQKFIWLKSQGKSAMLEAAMLKLHLGEGFVASSLDAVRNRGGRGYLAEFGVERDLRDAIGGILYAGTSDIQRNIIAGFLGL